MTGIQTCHGYVNGLGLAMGLSMTITITIRLGLGLGVGDLEPELLIFEQNSSSSSFRLSVHTPACRQDERELDDASLPSQFRVPLYIVSSIRATLYGKSLAPQ